MVKFSKNMETFATTVGVHFLALGVIKLATESMEVDHYGLFATWLVVFVLNLTWTEFLCSGFDPHYGLACRAVVVSFLIHAVLYLLEMQRMTKRGADFSLVGPIDMFALVVCSLLSPVTCVLTMESKSHRGVF